MIYNHHRIIFTEETGRKKGECIMLINDKKRIGEKLAKFRKASGMTQEEFADAAGVSLRAYTNIERGVTDMHVSTLALICDALNISPDDILYEEPENYEDLQDDLVDCISSCTDKEKRYLLKFIAIYLKALRKTNM